MIKAPTSKITKVNLAWGGIIFGGIAAFVAAKISVDKNRYKMMHMKQQIKDRVAAEAAEEKAMQKS